MKKFLITFLSVLSSYYLSIAQLLNYVPCTNCNSTNSQGNPNNYTYGQPVSYGENNLASDYGPRYPGGSDSRFGNLKFDV